MFSGDQLVFGLDDATKSYTDKAEKRKYLYHYTNYEAFLHIVKGKTLKFNRIDKVNDVQESDLFIDKEIAQLVYIACFTKQIQESIPMWSIYTQGREGIRLKFECGKDHLSSELFDKNRNVQTSDGQSIGVIGKAYGYYDITDWFVDFVQSDICYTDITKIEETFIKIADKYDLNKMAVVKDNAWKFEKESRIIMRMRTTKSNVEIPNIDFFLVPIAFRRLKQLEITFSPWMDDIKKRRVKNIVQKYMPDVAVKYKESKFANKINRKM